MKVLIESRFASRDWAYRWEYKRYLELAMLDSMARGESPYASHALYTQFLDDDDPQERSLGIEMGLEWGGAAEYSALYTDCGISKGMDQGIDRAFKERRVMVFRYIPGYPVLGLGVHDNYWFAFLVQGLAVLGCIIGMSNPPVMVIVVAVICFSLVVLVLGKDLYVLGKIRSGYLERIENSQLWREETAGLTVMELVDGKG